MRTRTIWIKKYIKKNFKGKMGFSVRKYILSHKHPDEKILVEEILYDVSVSKKGTSWYRYFDSLREATYFARK